MGFFLVVARCNWNEVLLASLVLSEKQLESHFHAVHEATSASNDGYCEKRCIAYKPV